MKNLVDSPGEVSRIDTSGMLDVVKGFPGQIKEALEIRPEPARMPSADGINSVVVLGMGGSGISGDVVGAACAGSLKVPLVTVKGYHLPDHVGPDTLVFAVSYSGNTEETLDCFGRASARGARLVAVTSGGRLAELALEGGVPIYRIPPGFQPRASLGYLFVPIVSALEQMGAVSGVARGLKEALPMLERRSEEYGPDVPMEENPAKRLAVGLVNSLPVIYGQEGALAVAARRWKAQVNENAKVPAFDNWFPELNHNETVGWQNHAGICSMCHLVMLRQPEEHPRVSLRVDITSELISGSVGHVTQVYARGDTGIERLLDIIYLGDFMSVYLAIELEQDPTPVTRIEKLKRRLADAG